MGSYILTSLGSAVLGSGRTVHAGTADTGADQTFTTFSNQPDVPRCIVATPSGTTGNVTAVNDYVEGTDVWGNFISENLPAYSAGAATAVTSVNAFKTITKYVQRANGTAVTITVTCSPKIGLGAVTTLPGVRFGYLGGVLEATNPTAVAGGATISKNLVTLNSALNGTAVVVAYIPN
jgi:hypothetical protein